MLPDIQTLLKPRPKRYRNIAKHLSNYIMVKNIDDFEYIESELFSDLSHSRGSSRLLGTFSVRGIKFILAKFGFFEALDRIGLPNGKVEFDVSKPYQHRVRITHNIAEASVCSSEIVLRRGPLNIPAEGNIFVPALDCLIVEWFMLQHPFKNFSRKRPQLPGQDYPGLGISTLVYELLYWTGRRLQVDGVVLVPNYLHTGIFYGRQLLFLNPFRQGMLYSLSKLLHKQVNLDQLTWACAEGQLIDKTNNKSYIWSPAPMAIPVSSTLRDYFHSHSYNEIVRTSKESNAFEINSGYHKRYTPIWETLS
jgi:hypothetical protein